MDLGSNKPSARSLTLGTIGRWLPPSLTTLNGIKGVILAARFPSHLPSEKYLLGSFVNAHNTLVVLSINDPTGCIITVCCNCAVTHAAQNIANFSQTRIQSLGLQLTVPQQTLLPTVRRLRHSAGGYSPVVKSNFSPLLYCTNTQA